MNLEEKALLEKESLKFTRYLLRSFMKNKVGVRLSIKMMVIINLNYFDLIISQKAEIIEEVKKVYREMLELK